VLVPERLCDVTVADEAGVRHTIRLMARSVNTAACYFFARSRSSPAVYRVEHRRMLEWANRTAERQWAKTKTA
jgi:hypothetical protein